MNEIEQAIDMYMNLIYAYNVAERDKDSPKMKAIREDISNLWVGDTILFIIDNYKTELDSSYRSYLSVKIVEKLADTIHLNHKLKI